MPERELLELSREECLGHLAGQRLGRLAFIDIVGVLPLIIPVNYLLDGDRVVFRTDPGSKLTAAILGAPVAFEVDAVDESHRTGWSVVVRGHAEQVTDEADLARLHEAPLAPLAPGLRTHYVRVVPGRITGRRISFVRPPSTWWG